MIIIEDWLEKDLCDFLEQKLLYETPHYYGHRSLEKYEDVNLFYKTVLNQQDNLMSFLISKLRKNLNEKSEIFDLYMNVQHPGMDGAFHTDPGDLTCLYMLTGEGDFQIKNEESISFKKNKLICFDAKKLHRGLAPKKGARITVVFKTEIIGEKNDR